MLLTQSLYLKPKTLLSISITLLFLSLNICKNTILITDNLLPNEEKSYKIETKYQSYIYHKNSDSLKVRINENERTCAKNTYCVITLETLDGEEIKKYDISVTQS